MSHTFRSLREAVTNVLVESIKVPQKFIDHAREVGSTVLYAELTYRNWSKRGLTDQQILDKITKHGKEQTKEESVEDAAVAIEEAVASELDEAQYGENTPARKIAAAKSFIKQYEQSLKHAIADGKPAETVNFWKKRLAKEKKALADLTKNESVEELDEASTLELGFRKVEKMIGDVIDELNPSRSNWAKNVIKADPENKQHIVKAFNLVKEADGELNDIVIKSIKKSLDNIDEETELLDETFTPEARKAIQLVTNLDAVDMEQFLQGFALYLDNSVVDDGDDFDKLGKIINKARQTWKARKGN